MAGKYAFECMHTCTVWTCYNLLVHLCRGAGVRASRRPSGWTFTSSPCRWRTPRTWPRPWWVAAAEGIEWVGQGGGRGRVGGRLGRWRRQGADGRGSLLVSVVRLLISVHPVAVMFVCCAPVPAVGLAVVWFARCALRLPPMGCVACGPLGHADHAWVRLGELCVLCVLCLLAARRRMRWGRRS